MKNMTKYKIHPIAALFPMMSEDDLNELADDIEQNGLIHPITVAKDYIIDGRNRLKACEIAKVDPEFTEFEGESIEAFIVSANIARRNLSKGQQAMARALIYPEQDERGRGKKGKYEDSSHFSQKRLQQARTIIKFSREMAEDVLAGRQSIDEALDEVSKLQGKSKNEVAKKKELRKSRPDLADRVEDEEISLEEAIEQAKQDDEQLMEDRNALTRSLVAGLRDLDREPEDAEDDASKYNPNALGDKDKKVTPERLRHVSDYLLALADAMETTKTKKGTK